MNTNITEKLYNIYLEQKLAHAYLIETNDVNKSYEQIEQLVKQIFCENEYKKNCKNCNICNLINNRNLPNYIVIEPDGKSIKKSQIDDLKKSCSTIPLLVKKNIYVIKYADKMNETTFNKMLKFLEEPEDNIIGFYITDKKENILSTVLSRLEIIKDYYDIPVENLLSEDLKNKTDIFINKIENNSKDLLWYNECVLMESLKEHVTLINFFKYIFNYYKGHANKNSVCNNKLKIINKYLEKLNYNVNSQLLLNSFVIEMSDINEK